jgi:hypothetical protein
MLRAIEPYEREVKKIDLRRDRETRKHQLEKELEQARLAEVQQVNKDMFMTDVHN